MVALMGDAEARRGQHLRVLLEGWKQGLRNVLVIVDYNRQKSRRCHPEGLWQATRAVSHFRLGGRDPENTARCSKRRSASPGRCSAAVDRPLPNQLYFGPGVPGGAAGRRRLNDDIGDTATVTRLIEAHRTTSWRAYDHLAGHDLPTLMDAFGRIHDRPSVSATSVWRSGPDITPG